MTKEQEIMMNWRMALKTSTTPLNGLEWYNSILGLLMRIRWLAGGTEAELAGNVDFLNSLFYDDPTT